MAVSSADILIADAITTAINAADLSLELTAERLYAADWDVKKELGALQCGVWPAESTAEPWQRNQLLKTHRIGITFAQSVSAAAIADLDAISDVANEVAELLELTVVSLADGRQFVNQSWEYVLRFDANRLDRNKGADNTPRYTGIFASMLAFEFTALE